MKTLNIVQDHINDIFVELQRRHGITDGAIDPLDSLALEEKAEEIANIIDKVINYEIELNG